MPDEIDRHNQAVPRAEDTDAGVTTMMGSTSEPWESPDGANGSSHGPWHGPALTGQRVLPEGFLLSVLMPVYNEQATIRAILARVLTLGLPVEIVVVDDGSTDGTREVLRSEVDGKWPHVRVLYHARNSGKGAAVRTAIAHATGTVCVVQDADLEYDPAEYLQLLEPILDGRADAVFGSRFIGGGAHRVHLFWHYVGNTLPTTLSNMLTNLNLTDMETCYKVIRTDLLRSLPLRANARKRARIYEVPRGARRSRSPMTAATTTCKRCPG